MCICVCIQALPMWYVFDCLCFWVSGCLNKDIIAQFKFTRSGRFGGQTPKFEFRKKSSKKKMMKYWWLFIVIFHHKSWKLINESWNVPIKLSSSKLESEITWHPYSCRMENFLYSTFQCYNSIYEHVYSVTWEPQSFHIWSCQNYKIQPLLFICRESIPSYIEGQPSR